MEKLKVGDTVQVMSGQESSGKEKASKRGKILKIDREALRVTVEGLRMVKRHLKKGRNPAQPDGGIIEKPGTIALASLALVCPKCDAPTRVGIRTAETKGDEKAKKVRFCKKCEAAVD